MMSELSKKQRMLLRRAVTKDGRVSVGMARKLYSSSSAAEESLGSLEFQGFIRPSKDVVGKFDVVKVPADLKKEFGKQL